MFVSKDNTGLPAFELPVKGRDWTLESRIIFALMGRLAISKIILTNEELDPKEGGLLINELRDGIRHNGVKLEREVK